MEKLASVLTSSYVLKWYAEALLIQNFAFKHAILWDCSLIKISKLHYLLFNLFHYLISELYTYSALWVCPNTRFMKKKNVCNNLMVCKFVSGEYAGIMFSTQ